jgi:preprotein translocase subunit SecY
MLSAFKNSLKIPELRQRIIFTLCMVVIVRMGAAIPVPGVNPKVLGEFFRSVVDQSTGGTVIGMFNLFSGGALENCALFSLSIMPYISASIMMQLLTAVIPSLAKKAREEGGRQMITQYTRVLTLALCLFQGYLLAKGFESPESIHQLSGIKSAVASYGQLVPNPGLLFELTTVISLTTGTMLLMWLGEQITEKGIGNGISLVITVGIVSRLPGALVQGWQVIHPTAGSTQEPISPLILVVLLAFLFGVIAATIAVTQAMRKVAVQYAKQVRGNKVYGGQTSYLPLKVNYAGVMPIIFAQAILLFPSMMITFIFGNEVQWVHKLTDALNDGWVHYSLYGAMILFFSYFWVATQFNPVQISDDMKKHGGFIPGVRPGQPTADFLEYSMTRLTLAGAVFLTFLAVLPMMVQKFMHVPQLTAQFFGGTSLLIMVGVMLDTMRQTETYLLQRHYDGFLKKGRLRGRSAFGQTQAGQAAESNGLIYLGAVVGLIVIAGIVITLIKG